MLINLLLTPIFFHRKDDFLTPIFAVIAAVLSYYHFSATMPVTITSGPATVTVSWQDNAKIDGNKIKGFARTDSDDVLYATYTFRTEEEKLKFNTLNLPAYAFTLSGSYREADIPSHAYAFNMAEYMKTYGAAGLFEASSIIKIEEKRTIGARLAEQRRKVKQHIHKAFPEPLRTEAEALLIGDRSGMEDEETTIYRRLGITHLFAISGLHVGLLTFFVREFLLRMNVRKETAAVLLIVALPIYAVMAGGAPSVWRAVTVTMLILGTTLGRLKVDALNALAVSAIGFIFLEPFLVFQPGFQLSYIAALSLILSSELLARTRTTIGVSFLVTSVSQLVLYPVLLYHFYELSISSFLTNLLYVPLYSVVILPANIILLAVSYLLPPVADLLFSCYLPFRKTVGAGTAWFASMPYQLWTPGKPAVLLLVLAVAGVLCFFYRFEKFGRLWTGLPFIIMPALLIHFHPYTDGTLKVTYLDVGQGDSAVIELPYRRAVYVIDAGGTVPFGEPDWRSPGQPFEVGRKIVVPYLKGNGITKIDKLILSHPHLDHVGGASEVLEEVRVDEIHITPGSEIEKEMEEVVRLAAEKAVPIIPVHDGATWREGQFDFVYVGPQGDVYVGGNDSSLVLLMKTLGPSFLFTGDMEQEAEAQFVRKYGEIDFGPIILKAGHHGSKTSSTEPFVDAVRPELAVISAGRNNTYSHPHEEVLETFKKFAVPIMSTAENGTVTVTVRDRDYKIEAVQQ